MKCINNELHYNKDGQSKINQKNYLKYISHNLQYLQYTLVVNYRDHSGHRLCHWLSPYRKWYLNYSICISGDTSKNLQYLQYICTNMNLINLLILMPCISKLYLYPLVLQYLFFVVSDVCEAEQDRLGHQRGPHPGHGRTQWITWPPRWTNSGKNRVTSNAGELFEMNKFEQYNWKR